MDIIIIELLFNIYLSNIIVLILWTIYVLRIKLFKFGLLCSYNVTNNNFSSIIFIIENQILDLRFDTNYLKCNSFIYKYSNPNITI